MFSCMPLLNFGLNTLFGVLLSSASNPTPLTFDSEMKRVLLILMILSACTTCSDCYEDGQRLLHTWKWLRNIYLNLMLLFFPELVVRNVLNVLHEAGFSDGDWYQLGQQLIEMADLKTIDTNRRKVSDCMVVGVALWLHGVASWLLVLLHDCWCCSMVVGVAPCKVVGVQGRREDWRGPGQIQNVGPILKIV